MLTTCNSKFIKQLLKLKTIQMETKFLAKSASYLFMLFAALTMLTTSCSKEDEKAKEEEEQMEDGINSISFKADGVQKNVGSDGNYPLANFSSQDGKYQAAFTAKNDKVAIGFTINDIKRLSKKDYPDNYAYNTTPDPTFSKVSYSEYGDKVNNIATFITYNSSITGSNLLVTVTKIGPDFIGGTFKGKLYTPDGTSFVTITDGKFNMKMSPTGPFLQW